MFSTLGAVFSGLNMLAFWSRKPVHSAEPGHDYSTPSPIRLTHGRSRPPRGLHWRSVHDDKLNKELYAKRIGMLDHEVIELWAPDWMTSIRILSLSADQYIYGNSDIMWRPVHCPDDGAWYQWVN